MITVNISSMLPQSPPRYGRLEGNLHPYCIIVSCINLITLSLAMSMSKLNKDIIIMLFLYEMRVNDYEVAEEKFEV